MKAITLILALAVAAPIGLVACGRTVESQTKTTSENGSTKVEKKTVTENPNGGVTVDKEKKTVNENP